MGLWPHLLVQKVPLGRISSNSADLNTSKTTGSGRLMEMSQMVFLLSLTVSLWLPVHFSKFHFDWISSSQLLTYVLFWRDKTEDIKKLSLIDLLILIRISSFLIHLFAFPIICEKYCFKYCFFFLIISEKYCFITPPKISNVHCLSWIGPPLFSNFVWTPVYCFPPSSKTYCSFYREDSLWHQESNSLLRK